MNLRQRKRIYSKHHKGELKMINLMSLIGTFGTSKLIALVREVLEMIVDRTDNEIDNEAVDLIFAILSGKAEDIVKEARELAAEIAETVAEEVLDEATIEA